MDRAWPRQPEPEVGQFLLATPTTRDPNFDRTVVLMVEHAEPGSLGLVVNRITPQPVPGPVRHWVSATGHQDTLLAGGPVEIDALLGVARAARGAGLLPIDDELSMLDLATDADGIDELERAWIFAGYAGWGAGQLANEIRLDGWWVADRLPGDLESIGQQDLWARIVRRQPGLERFATFPADPGLN